MPPRPSFDRALLLPIAVGVLSVLGMAWLLSTSNLKEGLLPPTAAPTAVPFDMSALETEAVAFYPSPTPTRGEPSPTPTEAPTETPLPTGTPAPESSATPTPGQIQPLAVGKYDDTDANIAYDRFWTPLQNPGTKNAYKGTIHASTAIGNEASFRFTGEGFILGYQRGKNFGTVTVIIDGQPYSFHEQAFGLVWRSPQLSPGDHFVRIVHESGEFINLDYIEILD